MINTFTGMAHHFKLAQPKEYYRQFLERDVRPDGRELGEYRPTAVTVDSITTAEGSALVKVGNTTVLCGIKAELASPKTEEPKKGFIVPNVELSPMCSLQFRPGPPPEQAQVMSQFIRDIITSSACILEEDLCVQEGKLVWVLYCDMVCLDYDGNVADACLIGLMAALKTTLLPGISLSEETADVFVDFSKKSPVVVHSLPVATTFSIFDDEILSVDPTVEEENLATGIITIITLGKQLCGVHKPGGTPLSPAQLQKCIDRAIIRSVEVAKLIEESSTNIER